jgi:hypothetical protein
VYLVDPPGTLLRAALLGVLAGLLLALTAMTAIYLYARYSRPRVERGRVWADWRRRPFLWTFSLLLTAAAVVPLCDQLVRPVVMRDLYWVPRITTVIGIARLGGGSGYLLALFVAALGAAIVRQRLGHRIESKRPYPFPETETPNEPGFRRRE